MPIELAQTIVCMAMERAYHETQTECSCFSRQAAITDRRGKCATNIIGTATIRSISIEEAVDNC